MKLSQLYENSEAERPAPGTRLRNRFRKHKNSGDLDNQTPEDVLLQKELRLGAMPDTASPSDVRGVGRQL